MTAPYTLECWMDDDSSTFTYVVADRASGQCAVIDSVLDYDAAAGRTSTTSADKVIDCVRARGWQVQWLLETHVHADHLSAAPYLRQQLGGRIGIGEHIRTVQRHFAGVFNAGPGFACDGSQFDHLFTDGERFAVGSLPVRVLHTPGHTPACLTYLFEPAGHTPFAFVGDTIFMPDYGTARCDFPSGSARQLYQSIHERLYTLAPETVLYMCHDYLPEGPAPRHRATVADERAGNVHIHDGVSEAAFVAQRRERDATLGAPRLLLPSIQVNMRAGQLPPAEDNGVRYLKIPLNQ